MRLSDKIVADLPPPPRGSRIVYDSLVKGFGCRVTAAGSRAFVLNYRRKADGRERRFTIGSVPDWGVPAARNEARRLKRDIDLGSDPLGDLAAGRAAPTVAELCERFLNEHVPRVRPSTARDYRQQIGADIVPAIGRLKVAAIAFADIDDLHRKISARAPTHANRVLACLSRMFSLAIRWGMRAANPCRGVERNQEHKRTRHLNGDEIAHLTTALTELRDQQAANAVRLLLLTGARRGELLSARWTDLDLVAGVWTKPGATTKQKTTHRVPLSAPAVHLLGEMQSRAGDAPWLFPARSGGHLTDIDKAWDRLREAADFPGVRLHDLRHTYASVLASAGLSLPVIGALLGHTQPATTARYAHLLDDPLRAATERVAAIVMPAKGGA
jgi:integrase